MRQQSVIRQAAVLILCVLLGIALEHARERYFSTSAADQDRLRKTNRLFIQQIDTIGSAYLETLSAGNVSTAEREFLEKAWILYDRKFIELNSNEAVLTYELSSSARRVGFACLYIGQHDMAEEYLLLAVSLLETLTEDYPTLVSYRFDQSAARILLAQLYAKTRQPDRGLEQCKLALATIQVEKSSSTGEYIIATGQTLLALAKQFAIFGQVHQARSVLIQNLEILSTRSHPRADQVVLQQLLDESRALLVQLEGAD